MAFETINLGTQPAGTGGDTARSAFEKTNRNFLAADVLSAAMSQAQFEAIRAQNKERYAASGWVSFGNHESAKQVNECKPGLYTSLTTPNTLLIGKAGGVGGSKTDHASVHIDGVIFNLTNQFVLTLPSHPTSVLPERMDMYGVESEKVEISSASPNAYQGGLRGVGAAVNLFTATDQQKKDFFAQNSNTTFIGSDGKIYQWQLYKIAFAGTTGGVPSPTEQGYSLNSFGDLWLKAGKNLLYFGNILRLNDGGYHPSFNPLGAAKFVGDTFWFNTLTTITSRADCFNPDKLLAGSGLIASGKSGREVDGRYADVIYEAGFGGVCRDMRYIAKGIKTSDCLSYEINAISEKCRGFEIIERTKGAVVTILQSPFDAFLNGVDCRIYRTSANINDFAIKNIDVNSPLNTQRRSALKYQGVTYRGGVLSGNGYNIDFIWVKSDGESPNITANDEVTVIITGETNKIIGGPFLQLDVFADPDYIISNSHLSGGWNGNLINGIPDGTSKEIEYSRRKIGEAANKGFAIWTYDSGMVWDAGTLTASGNDTKNTFAEISVQSNFLAIIPYIAFAKLTEPAVNSIIEGLIPYNVFASSDYRPENGALLGESLIGKVLKNNSGVSVNNKSLLSCAIDSTGKLTSAANFDGITHQALTLGAPANNSPAFKVVSYLANINQQAVPHFAYTELRHNGTSFGDDGKQTIVDNQSTKLNDHGVTVVVGTARLREPLGWFKNKV
ncbi:hypothetical protein [Shewanella sp. 8A]|uniref:hypothetical protein n=1 Tax=Shewanella sp. 8A TaxID=2943323 RepID=UPI00201A3C63|nr:hypothetical protein [Shewanella sp. 8A]